jgi:hypothetical protein
MSALRLDVLDQRSIARLNQGILPGDHLSDACSSVQTKGAMLCDCGAVAVAWARVGGQGWERYVPPANLDAARTKLAPPPMSEAVPPPRPRGRPRKEPA